jgi:hypothetical protein
MSLMSVVTLTMMMVNNNWSSLFLPWLFDLVCIFLHGRWVTIDTDLIIYTNDDNSDDECIVLERKKKRSSNNDWIQMNIKRKMVMKHFFNEYKIVKKKITVKIDRWMNSKNFNELSTLILNEKKLFYRID